MGPNVDRFRRLKWGDPPQKLKVLSEDLAPRRRSLPFALVLFGTFAAAFAFCWLLQAFA